MVVMDLVGGGHLTCRQIAQFILLVCVGLGDSESAWEHYRRNNELPMAEYDGIFSFPMLPNAVATACTLLFP